MEFKAYGRDAVLVTHAESALLQLPSGLLATAIPEVTESIAAEDSLLLRVCGPVTPELIRQLRTHVEGLLLGNAQRHPSHDEVVRIPVVYDGDDLDEVAATVGLSSTDVIGLHTSVEYLVAFSGFAPGFAYLTHTPEALRIPRRETPRTLVPAGAVAIAEHYSAVYPRSSPGGWHLIGHSETTMFDPDRSPPATLQSGMRVRFDAVRERISARDVSAVPQKTHADTHNAHVALEVISTGALALIEDLGRLGFADAAVTSSGAWDRFSHRLAARLVGNDESAAGLECLGGGLHLRALRAVTIAVTGADGTITHVRQGIRSDTDSHAPLTLATGDEVIIGPPRTGLRRYVAIRGGVRAPLTLGSRSFDTLSALGPPPVQAGDLISIATSESWRDAGSLRPVVGIDAGVRPIFPTPATSVEATLVSPARDDLTDETWQAWSSGSFTVSSRSDRVGVRLEGPPLVWRPGYRAPRTSRPLVRGAIQVPPDGQPVIMGPDHPTTGGYPVIGVLQDPDAPAQWPAGVHLRLHLAQW